MRDKQVRTDDEWRDLLTSEQFRVLRRAGTEPAFSGTYTDVFDEGVYSCAGCGSELFDSATKFRSGCGWPSFSKSVADDAVIEHEDFGFGTRFRCDTQQRAHQPCGLHHLP